MSSALWIAFAVSAAALGFMLARLVWSGAWSFHLAVALAAVMLLSLGWLVGPELVADVADVWGAILGLEFVRPWWLVLLAVVPLVVLVGRRSLTGLGKWRKWVAIAARTAIVACLVVALAEPRVRRSSEHVTVLFVIDRSLSVPPEPDPDTRGRDGEAIDRRWERTRGFVNDAVRFRGPDKRNDRAGVILFGRRPKLVLPAAAVDRLPIDERLAGPIDGEYTDIAAALKLALASFPEGTGKRIVLISDGNENLGRAEEQAQLARQQGVQIDVLPLAVGYRNENEVLVQSVEAPARVAGGQQLPVRVLVRNAHPTRLVDGVLEVIEIRDREARPL
ncbi:MAG TPA: vWA domain-containing protein, partial [Gemmataceae bacterium]|nr:vWA domain-containing protein [Gemmataceae bacterium]